MADTVPNSPRKRGKRAVWDRIEASDSDEKAWVPNAVVAAVFRVQKPEVTNWCRDAQRDDGLYDLAACGAILLGKLEERARRSGEAQTLESADIRLKNLKSRQIERDLQLKEGELMMAGDVQAALDKLFGELRADLTTNLANKVASRFNLGRDGYDQILKWMEDELRRACDHWEAWQREQQR